jgi:hemerythrin
MGIEWTDSIAIGVEEIDSQHKELLQRFNDLLSACKSGKARDELATLMAFLDDYVVRHFGFEEQLQSAHRYPDYEEHKNEHDDFIQKLCVIKAEISADGLSIHHVIETNNMLLKWLLNHISRSDKALGIYLRSVA